MGSTQLWKAPFTQFQVPAVCDEGQSFTQQDQVFLWGNCCSWGLEVWGFWCPKTPTCTFQTEAFLNLFGSCDVSW